MTTNSIYRNNEMAREFQVALDRMFNEMMDSKARYTPRIFVTKEEEKIIKKYLNK